VKKERKNHFATGSELDNMEEEKNAAHILLSVTPTEKRKNQSQLVITQNKPVNGLERLSLLQRSHIVTGNQTLVVNKKKCCSWTVKCFGKKCYNLRKKCKWTGKVVIEKFNHGCRWVTVGKNARRHQCCKQKKTCVGKECTTPEDFDCKWTGEAVMRNLETRCTWSKKNHASVQTCCKTWKRCIGKVCQRGKTSCKVADYFVEKKKEEIVLGFYMEKEEDNNVVIII